MDNMNPVGYGMNFPHFQPLNFRNYQNYLPTAYDNSLSMQESLLQVLNFCNEIGLLNQHMSDNWNMLLGWIKTNGIDDAVTAKLNEWVADGTMAKVLDKTVLNQINQKMEELLADYPQQLQDAKNALNSIVNTFKNDTDLKLNVQDNKIQQNYNSLMQKLSSTSNVQDNKIQQNYKSLMQQLSSISNGVRGVYPNLSALTASKPDGDTGTYVTTDNGHWFFWNGNAWTDAGVYQAAGPDPELVDLRTDYRGDNYETAGEAIRSDFSTIAKQTQTNSLAHRVMTSFDALGFTSAVKTAGTLFTGIPTFDDATPKIGSKFAGNTDGKTYWFTLAVAVRGYDVLQATFTYPDNPSTYSIFYLNDNNQIVRIEHFDKSDSSGQMSDPTRYTISNYPIYCDYNVSTVLIASIDSRPSASIRVRSTVADVPTKGHWINGSDFGNGSLNTTNMGFRVTTDLPICYDYDVTVVASGDISFFAYFYADPSGNSASTKLFPERTWMRIPAGQYFRLTLCHADGNTSPLDINEAVNALRIRVDSRFNLANQREMLAQAELADRHENIYALVAQDAHDAGKHYHMDKIVDNDEAAKTDLDGFQSVYLDGNTLHMFGYHGGKAVDRTWQDGKVIKETVKPDTGHDGDATKIGDAFYIIGSSINDGKVEGNVIYRWDSAANTREIIDISSRIGTPADTTHVRFVTGIDRIEGSNTQLIIVTTDGLPDLGKGPIRSASDRLIFWKYDIPSDTLSEINEMRWTETFVQGVTCLDGITYIAVNPSTRNASDYAGIKIIGYDSGSFRKIREIYIKGSFEAEGLSSVVDNGVPKLVFGLCHYKDLMRVYKLTL